MDDLDPTTAASFDDLAARLRHVHLLADKPTYRALEQQTAREGGFLPGTRLRRVRLTRSTLSDVLLGRKFPGKAFLLTFVDVCGIDLEKDRRWEQAWDRLAPQYLDQAAEAEVEAEQLRRQLAELKAQANRVGKEVVQLRQQLADAEDLIRQQTLAAEKMASRLEDAQTGAREAHDRLTEATAAHAAGTEQIRAEAQARVDEIQVGVDEAIQRGQAAAVRAAETRIAETEQQARELAEPGPRRRRGPCPHRRGRPGPCPHAGRAAPASRSGGGGAAPAAVGQG